MTLQRRLALAAAFLLSMTVFAAAQDSPKQERLRAVSGVVSDKQDNYIAEGVVVLKNTRTQAVQSRITTQDGNYRFTGLDPNADYEIHAEKDGAKSPTRTVSSFDTRHEIVLNLKIDLKRK